MTTIAQPTLIQLYKMLSADSNKETEFGKLLLKIIKKPIIPVSKELLCHPSPPPNKPGQPHRFKKTPLTNEAYTEVREKWNEIIQERNKFTDSHGLSYDYFMLMVQDLYGCDDVRSPQMPLTRESVDHLVHTGNPWRKTKPALSIQEYHLSFICCFTESPEETFKELKAAGQRTLEEYQKIKHETTKIKEPARLSFDFPTNNKKSDSLYLTHSGNFTKDASRANNLRGLVWNAAHQNGKEYFLRAGISAEELLSLILESNPSLRMSSLQSLVLLLDIPPERLVEMLADDTSDLDVGF